MRLGSLTEGQIRFDPSFVGLVHTRHFAEVPLAFGVFGGKQMTPGRLRAQNFAGAGYFKPFCDRFTRFAARDWLRHEARKIDAVVALTTSFDLDVERERLLADC